MLDSSRYGLGQVQDGLPSSRYSLPFGLSEKVPRKIFRSRELKVLYDEPNFP